MALIAAVGVIGGVWAGRLAQPTAAEARPAASYRYVVRPGDTVWSVAVRFGDRPDPRPLVAWIEAANHLRGDAVRPGQTLVVPAA